MRKNIGGKEDEAEEKMEDGYGEPEDDEKEEEEDEEEEEEKRGLVG